MVRSTAREIAVHLSYELSFTDLTVEQLLERHLSAENFASLAEEDPLYRELPNAKQREYICRLVRGVSQHAGSWTPTLTAMPRGGSSPGCPWWRQPSCGWPCMRSCICRISPTAPPSTRRWSWRKYEGDEVAKFVNGILGAFVRAEVKE